MRSLGGNAVLFSRTVSRKSRNAEVRLADFLNPQESRSKSGKHKALEQFWIEMRKCAFLNFATYILKLGVDKQL
jgi:hypothetical protein